MPEAAPVMNTPLFVICGICQESSSHPLVFINIVFPVIVCVRKQPAQSQRQKPRQYKHDRRPPAPQAFERKRRKSRGHSSAARPDRILANSRAVARRVARWWGREAHVVHPPAAVERFAPTGPGGADKPYLCFGQLVAYKRADLAVTACLRSGRKLVVAGAGTELPRQIGRAHV